MDKQIVQEEKALAAQESLLTPEERKEAVAGARRNDLRLLLGILFCAYGVIVTCVGIFNPGDGMDKTGGIAINLWSGIIMLLVGLGFLAWNFARPIPEADIIESAEESARHAAEKKQTMRSEIQEEEVNQEDRAVVDREVRDLQAEEAREDRAEIRHARAEEEQMDEETVNSDMVEEGGPLHPREDHPINEGPRER